jgi:hypothetical protein
VNATQAFVDKAYSDDMLITIPYDAMSMSAGHFAGYPGKRHHIHSALRHSMNFLELYFFVFC